MRIFFAGPLTDLRNPQKTKAWYRRLAGIARSSGVDFFWAFLNGTDPVKNPDIPPRQVYQVDTQQLAASDIMVAYVGEPSTGTGIEIEFAKNHHIPVYLLYEKGKKISRMLRGCPAIAGELPFATKREGLRTFEQFLKRLLR